MEMILGDACNGKLFYEWGSHQINVYSLCALCLGASALKINLNRMTLFLAYFYFSIRLSVSRPMVMCFAYAQIGAKKESNVIVSVERHMSV